MRLVNAKSLQFEEFFGEGIPKYAILSHTWTDGQEVTLQEFSAQKARNKSGWTKIQRTAQLALEDELHHIWIDTCCIDKTSSAELTEAINSMMAVGLGQNYKEDAFRRSRWFTRGWTLQELLAPSKLIFISTEWTRFGTRDEMAYVVSDITGIDTEFLHPPEGKENNDFSANNMATASTRSLRARLDSASIAQRMSWASKRRTTRVEDAAYCLLGIFDINMPLLYGEGPKAFLRLQEQIMMQSDDQSLLAWNFEGFETKQVGGDRSRGESWRADCLHGQTYAGLFATSPSAFSTCQNIERVNIGKPTPHSFITNKGIYVRARLPLALVDYQLLLRFRPTELYALKYGDYTMPRATGKDYTIMKRDLPEDVKVLRAWGESGSLEPDSQIILQSNGRDDKLTGGTLLLCDHISGKPKFVLVVVSKRQSAISDEGPLEMSGLIELDRLEDCWSNTWDSTHPLNSENLSRMLEEAKRHHFDQWPDCGIKSTVYAADGIYTTTTEVQFCFGKPVIFVDASLKLRPHDDIQSLWRQLPWWLRYHIRGHSGINRAMLLLVLAPRICTIVIELLARKAARTLEAAVYPWYMVPLMTDYVFLPAGDPPRFLVSTLARGRKETVQTLKRRAAISLLAYLSCKLIGSDTLLERFKKFLASKK
ncbi:Vegetative incompatibility protein HET-E-1 [Colletotrichum fructicola]|nr:Vegetative incompatibility protein HET-E-1 [Colletotrichum fructicola]